MEEQLHVDSISKNKSPLAHVEYVWCGGLTVSFVSLGSGGQLYSANFDNTLIGKLRLIPSVPSIRRCLRSISDSSHLPCRALELAPHSIICGCTGITLHLETSNQNSQAPLRPWCIRRRLSRAAGALQNRKPKASLNRSITISRGHHG